MPSAVPLPPPGFDQLPVDEQIDYVQSLWDRIAADPGEVPLPDWHRQVLADRLRELAENPAIGDAWPTVRDRIRAKLGSTGR